MSKKKKNKNKNKDSSAVKAKATTEVTAEAKTAAKTSAEVKSQEAAEKPDEEEAIPVQDRPPIMPEPETNTEVSEPAPAASPVESAAAPAEPEKEAPEKTPEEKEMRAFIAKNVQEIQDKKELAEKKASTGKEEKKKKSSPAAAPAKKKPADKASKKRVAGFVAAVIGIAVLLGVGIKLSGSLSAPNTDEIVEPTPPPIITTNPGDVARDPVDGLPEKSHVHGQYVAAEENTQYATIKAPDVGLEAPLFYGDTQEILKVAAFGQSTKTPQIGNLSSHLICTYDENLSSKVLQMEAGNRFCIETNYGSYVYSVTSTTEGKINRKTGYIESVDGENLFRLDDETQDTVYIYTDDAEHNKHVVVGVLIE